MSCGDLSPARGLLTIADAIKKMQHLFGAQHDGKLLRFSWERNYFGEAPFLLEGYLVEKAERSYSNMYLSSCCFLLVCEIQLVDADVFRTQQHMRTDAEVNSIPVKAD
jgi:hypothetical protein